MNTNDPKSIVDQAPTDARRGVRALGDRVARLASERKEGHHDDVAVDAFAAAMKSKLAKARAKGRGGWQDKVDCPHPLLSDMLRHHVEKGDPVDVANFCMFLHQRGEGILPRAVAARHGALAEPAAVVTGFERGGDHEPIVKFSETFAMARGVSIGMRLFAHALEMPPAAGRDSSEPAVAAIQFALAAEEGMAFLRCWNEGNFAACRREWPDAPDDCYLGADPLLKDGKAHQ